MSQSVNFYIRDATLDDLPAIVAIYNSTLSSYQISADIEPITVESLVTWLKERETKARPVWVIVPESADDAVLGWLSFSDFYGRPAYRATAELSIYIEESWRGQGLGKYLLACALESAPELGISTVLGFVFARNTPSLKLFYSLGFSDWGLLPRVAKLNETEHDLIIVGRRV
ncbi:MAG: phosphinothricin acetyltransferase [Glomeribacter sp. 1016415]|uniref:GCN5-related N-acetyltransferase n=1 Tax=Mycoavidus cysteinexigens TaxID=1553431 RepID=A0A2Z6EUN2_9BURK|nr:GNAT family N-acetyltransferase [Mycoavidus cysteinexigens]MCX8567283.1 phosphinothricin acetyltransferase [Glomeribacter sp. 1016415]BBE09173.1 GCN5-related N-acetyltransferase [Mycoavidus cysteinexigens]GAM52082.1 sortase and related acyltransferases [bacterium endosymbiont of Mortierella elongata FMR23-6]GLR01880.1 phosphinothricin acetyltransferase [Mycoavidus cysteinexigens]